MSYKDQFTPWDRELLDIDILTRILAHNDAQEDPFNMILISSIRGISNGAILRMMGKV